MSPKTTWSSPPTEKETPIPEEAEPNPLTGRKLEELHPTQGESSPRDDGSASQDPPTLTKTEIEGTVRLCLSGLSRLPWLDGSPPTDGEVGSISSALADSPLPPWLFRWWVRLTAETVLFVGKRWRVEPPAEPADPVPDVGSEMPPPVE